MKKSFFNRQSPVVCLLYSPRSIDEAIMEARSAEFDGADAVCLQLDAMPLEQRSVENFRRVMNEVRLPFMFNDYRYDPLTKSDEEREKYLLMAAEAGAELVDVMGDFYDPSELELTRNPEAIERQMALVDKLHSLGAKVEMSSHIFAFRTGEQVLEQMQRQAERGADLLKVVHTANTPEELVQTIQTTITLHEKLDRPFVHLTNGKYGRPHRYWGAKLGNAICFAPHRYEAPSRLYAQPSIRSFRQVLDNMMWHIDDID